MKARAHRFLAMAISILLLASLVVNLSGCAGKVQAADLMKGMRANPVGGWPADKLSRTLQNSP